MARRRREPASFPFALVIGAVVSLGASVGAWMMMEEGATSSPSSPAETEAGLLEFPPLTIDERTLERQRAEKYGDARRAVASDGARKDVDELHDLVRKANRSQFEGTSVEQSQQQLSKRISVVANRVVEQTGYDGFVAAGEQMFDGCRDGLGDLLSVVREGALSLQEAKTSPPAEQFGSYRDNCGRVLPTLLRRGVVEEDGQWAEPAARHRAVFDLLQRYRWASIIADRRPPLEQLTRAGRRSFLRWRIETDAYAYDARRRFLDRVAQSSSLLPDYDPLAARVRLEVETGHVERAVSQLREALQSKEQLDRRSTYQRMLSKLEDRVADRDGPNGSNRP